MTRARRCQRGYFGNVRDVETEGSLNDSRRSQSIPYYIGFVFARTNTFK